MMVAGLHGLPISPMPLIILLPTTPSYCPISLQGIVVNALLAVVPSHRLASPLLSFLGPYLDRLHLELGTLPAALVFPSAGGRMLPFIVLFAILAPGFRSKKLATVSLELLRPEAAKILRGMQRDPAARFSLSTAGEAAIAVEYGAEGHLLVHYVDPQRQKSLTIAGGWLGAGRRQYMWLPLRQTLIWSSPGDPGPGSMLTSAEIGLLAVDLHAGLDQMGERHVLEEFLEPAPIPEAERREVLNSYATFMANHGWQVTYDESLSRRSLKRTSAAEGPQQWSTADREALTRMEALVTEMLKGVRSSSRVLFQTK
jgi:hypothetical protein